MAVKKRIIHICRSALISRPVYYLFLLQSLSRQKYYSIIDFLTELINDKFSDTLYYVYLNHVKKLKTIVTRPGLPFNFVFDFVLLLIFVTVVFVVVALPLSGRCFWPSTTSTRFSLHSTSAKKSCASPSTSVSRACEPATVCSRRVLDALNARATSFEQLPVHVASGTDGRAAHQEPDQERRGRQR